MDGPKKRRMTLEICPLKGEVSAAEAARNHGLIVAEVEDSREKFLLGRQRAAEFISLCHSVIDAHNGAHS